MATTDAAISDATCIEQCVPRGFQLPILISIFAELAGVSADPKSLIDSATCIEQCIPTGMQMPVLISLAQQILDDVSGIVVGGGSCLSRSVGVPVAAPAAGCSVAINITDAGAWYWWDSVSAAWIAFG